MAFAGICDIVRLARVPNLAGSNVLPTCSHRRRTKTSPAPWAATGSALGALQNAGVQIAAAIMTRAAAWVHPQAGLRGNSMAPRQLPSRVGGRRGGAGALADAAGLRGSAGHSVCPAMDGL